MKPIKEFANGVKLRNRLQVQALGQAATRADEIGAEFFARKGNGLALGLTVNK